MFEPRRRKTILLTKVISVKNIKWKSSQLSERHGEEKMEIS